MSLTENAEVEFAKWLDTCLKDGQGKLGLTWLEIAVQLSGKVQKALLLVIIEQANAKNSITANAEKPGSR